MASGNTSGVHPPCFVLAIWPMLQMYTLFLIFIFAVLLCFWACIGIIKEVRYLKNQERAIQELHRKRGVA